MLKVSPAMQWVLNTKQIVSPQYSVTQAEGMVPAILMLILAKVEVK